MSSLRKGIKPNFGCFSAAILLLRFQIIILTYVYLLTFSFGAITFFTEIPPQRQQTQNNGDDGK